MRNKFTKKRLPSLLLAAAGMIFAASAAAEQASAQTRDPFAKPSWAQPKSKSTSGAKNTPREKAKPKTPEPVAAPSIQDRINYYKQLRETAAMQGAPIPKVTSVLTLEEMSVTGIFRTPRGYAAMVEAKPIKLSYTIYPGEKFFDGQLVAIEENRLVFRKVIKMSDGKFIASEENKALRQYSVKQEVQATASVETPADVAKENSAKTETPENTEPATNPVPVKPAAPTTVVSPLVEMEKQASENAKETPAKNSQKGKSGAASSRKQTKKPVKVAANNQDQ